MFCIHCGKELKGDAKFCTECGRAQSSLIPSNKSVSTKKHLFITIGVIAFVSVLIWLGSSSDDYNEFNSSFFDEWGFYVEPIGYFDDMSLIDSETLSYEEWVGHIRYYQTEQENNVNTQNQIKTQAFSTVVKVVCEDDSYIYFGSGTNVDPAGYVLTNKHVIADADIDSCIVGFPNPTTGLIKELYLTATITDVDDETGHDLAYLAIESPLFDEEGNVYGYHEKVSNGLFPYFEYTNECVDVGPELGSKVLILGYPLLSGTALTVTDGLISSLYSPQGYLITSAKISAGNSGGLAMNEDGCYVGVPTQVYYEEDYSTEVLGEIIDAQFVFEFDEVIEDDLETYYKKRGIEFYTEETLSDNTVSSSNFMYLTIPGALRECPSVECRIIRYYAEGARVNISSETSSSWYQVTAHDDYGNLISGYMHQSLFR